MFPWLHRHMIDLSHIDVSIIDGWGTSQFNNRQDDEKWARRERLFLRRLKLWKQCGECCRQTQVTCMKESKTMSQTPAVSYWKWHSTDLTLSRTLAWSLALVSVLSFICGRISNGLNQQVKREKKVWNQDIFLPVDNSCSQDNLLNVCFWSNRNSWFTVERLEESVKGVVWPDWIMKRMLQ